MKTTNPNQKSSPALAVTLRDSQKLYEEAEKMIKQSLEAIVTSNQFLKNLNSTPKRD